jgi:hypothetical protein
MCDSGAHAGGKAVKVLPRQAPPPLFAAPVADDLSSHAYRQLIGSLGFVLPGSLWLIAGWRHTEELPQWGLLESVSDYYYTGAGALFVGILVALGVFLITYRGYKNPYGRRDRIAGVIAGTAALLVAFFPTGAPEQLPRPSWWTEPTGAIHFAAAAILFCAFSFFCLFQFPQSDVGAGEPLPWDKRLRNGIYRVCGIAMLGCIGWVVAAKLGSSPIFMPEALALEFFAASWLVKGRADRTAVAAGRRTVHYGRHPGHLVGDVLRAIRG